MILYVSLNQRMKPEHCINNTYIHLPDIIFNG